MTVVSFKQEGHLAAVKRRKYVHLESISGEMVLSYITFLTRIFNAGFVDIILKINGLPIANTMHLRCVMALVGLVAFLYPGVGILVP